MLSGWHLHPVSIGQRDQRPLHTYGVCQGQPWRQSQQPTRELCPGTDQKNNMYLWEMCAIKHFGSSLIRQKQTQRKLFKQERFMAQTRFTSCSCRRRIWSKHHLCKWSFTSRGECEVAECSVRTSSVILKLWYNEEVGSLKAKQAKHLIPRSCLCHLVWLQCTGCIM